MGKAPKDIIRIMAAECDVPGLLATVDALRARLAAAEGLLREAREAFDWDAWDDPAWSMARRIDAHLAAAQPGTDTNIQAVAQEQQCIRRRGMDVGSTPTGLSTRAAQPEQVPPNTCCAHDDKPEGGEVPMDASRLAKAARALLDALDVTDKDLPVRRVLSSSLVDALRAALAAPAQSAPQGEAGECRFCPHPAHHGLCTRRSGGTAYACNCHHDSEAKVRPA